MDPHLAVAAADACWYSGVNRYMLGQVSNLPLWVNLMLGLVAP